MLSQLDTFFFAVCLFGSKLFLFRLLCILALSMLLVFIFVVFVVVVVVVVILVFLEDLTFMLSISIFQEMNEERTHQPLIGKRVSKARKLTRVYWL